MASQAKQARDLFRAHRRRMLKCTLIGGSLFCIGLSLLYVLVAKLGIRPIYANLMLAVPMTAFGFYVNRRLAWSDRHTCTKPGLGKWSASKLLLGVTSQAAFLVLVGAFGLPYMFVRGGTVAALALPTYVASNGWVFKPQDKTEKA